MFVTNPLYCGQMVVNYRIPANEELVVTHRSHLILPVLEFPSFSLIYFILLPFRGCPSHALVVVFDSEDVYFETVYDVFCQLFSHVFLKTL